LNKSAAWRAIQQPARKLTHTFNASSTAATHHANVAPFDDAHTPGAQRIEFSNADGLRLVGELTHADSARAVVMVHGFLADQEGNGLFELVARELRRQGWGSLRFDLSGHGQSDDNVLTPESGRRDTASAIALMQALGYREIALWGQGLGSRWCLDMAAGASSVVLTDMALRLTPRERHELALDKSARALQHGRFAVDRLVGGAWRRHVVDPSLLDCLRGPGWRASLMRCACPVLALLPTCGAALSRQMQALHGLKVGDASLSAAVDRVHTRVVRGAHDAIHQGVAWVLQPGVSAVAPSRPTIAREARSATSASTKQSAITTPCSAA
jgi:pimeloyl-ACP methyl ester carboxylesterase